ncbi:hypothetical protein X943_002492 [Babesia divergens]|uniref:Uncharacterized protein n=1 Tax=Babesia divergens TaxID=32595 RepID=A0AAD9GFL5_BABDI|nr:hypothetical protein X943_002492 [Babesia divergens]
MATRGMFILGRNVFVAIPPLTRYFSPCASMLKPISAVPSSFGTLTGCIIPPLSHPCGIGSQVLLCGALSPSLPDPVLLSYRDDLRREQFKRIVGKIGIRKKDAGIYWNQYKTKRIKIRKKKRVI